MIASRVKCRKGAAGNDATFSSAEERAEPMMTMRDTPVALTDLDDPVVEGILVDLERLLDGDVHQSNRRGARHLVRQQPSGRVLVRVHLSRMPTQDPPAVSPTAPVPAARGRGAGLSVEITRGSNTPNAFFPLLRDVRCPVRRARVCAEKRNSRAKPRPERLCRVEHAARNSRKDGLFFIF